MHWDMDPALGFEGGKVWPWSWLLEGAIANCREGPSPSSAVAVSGLACDGSNKDEHLVPVQRVELHKARWRGGEPGG